MLNIALVILSLVLYYISPMELSMPIITMDLVVFFVGAISLMKNKDVRTNIMSFNYLFLLSFFLCTYAFSVFVLGGTAEFTMSVFALINFDYVTKVVSLSTVAISVYFCSYNYTSIRLRKIKLQESHFYVVSKDKRRTVNFIRTILFLGTVVNACLFIQSNSGSAITSALIIPELYKIFLILSLVISNNSFSGRKKGLKSCFIDNKTTIIEGLLLCLLYLMIGDRGLPISIVLTFLCVYSFLYKRLSLGQFILLATAGAIVLFAIRVTRAGDSSISVGGISAVASSTQDALSGKSLILIFSDLMGANSELCLGYEYVQKFGFQYPLKLLIVLTQPIPKLPSILGQLLYGKVPYELSLGSILNEYVGQSGFVGSFGNHMVADIYIYWGVIGIILLFWIFGRVISTIETKKHSSFYCMCAFIFIVSYSLYLPRDSMFTILRPLVFLWFFIKVLKLNPQHSAIDCA